MTIHTERIVDFVFVIIEQMIRVVRFEMNHHGLFPGEAYFAQWTLHPVARFSQRPTFVPLGRFPLPFGLVVLFFVVFGVVFVLRRLRLELGVAEFAEESALL